MLDLETYNRTRDLPGGPIVVAKQIPLEPVDDVSITIGVLVGRALGLAIIVALGIYASYFF